MARGGKWSLVLRAMLIGVLVILTSSAAFCLWLSAHYKAVLKQRLPEMIVKSSDSIYHVSFDDINVSLVKHTVSLTNVRLWADTAQVARLRAANRYSPNTVSFVYVPLIEAYGVAWEHILSNKSLDCKELIVHNPEWFMQTIKRQPDLSMVPENQQSSMVHRFTVDRFEIQDPHFTYHYVGDKNAYYFYVRGGKTILHNWAIDKDTTVDTSVVLWARYGSLRPDSIIYRNDGKIYTMKAPVADFYVSDTSVTLKDMKIKHMADMDAQTGKLMELYNFKFPKIEITHFNWKKLLHKDLLKATQVVAIDPVIDERFIRDDAPSAQSRMGAFPGQLIQDAVKTHIQYLYIKHGLIKYAEPVKGSDTDFIIHFDDISGTFKNIANTDKAVSQDNVCTIMLEGKYMGKSPVKAIFNFSLADHKGAFTMDGYIDNLNGDDVTQQASQFTMAKLTSFQLSHMEGHIKGNESSAHGDFVMRYHDLKISLFKFKTDDRKSKSGPFAFVADALVLYPDNPMPGKEVRHTSADLSRDPSHGFIYLIWREMYLAAQKTAVRNDEFIALAGGKTDDANKPKKQGLLKKLIDKFK